MTNYMEEQAALDSLFDDAQQAVGTNTRDMALFIIGELESDGSGAPWIDARISGWAVQGLISVLGKRFGKAKVGKKIGLGFKDAPTTIQRMQSVVTTVEGKQVRHYKDVRLFTVEEMEDARARDSAGASTLKDTALLRGAIVNYQREHDNCLAGPALDALDILAVDIEATA